MITERYMLERYSRKKSNVFFINIYKLLQRSDIMKFTTYIHTKTAIDIGESVAVYQIVIAHVLTNSI